MRVASAFHAIKSFIAGRLPNPSHELTVCRLEQATLRANQHARAFRAPGCEILSEAGCALRRGRYAGMVVFYATTVLFAPGLDRLYRVASPREVALWNMLAGTMPVGSLSTEGYRRPELASLLREGILEPTGV